MEIKLMEYTPDPEELIERAGRTCYQSQDKYINEQGKFIGDKGKLIRALIKSGHQSVLEHAYATFNINGVSRAMTHQLVRHRLCSFSQQSQRYVKEDQFEFVIPPSIAEKHKDLFESQMQVIQAMYNEWKIRGIKNEDARFVLPNACCSEIVVSANFRQWRKVFELRCDKHAQWEIRDAMTYCLMYLNKIAPNVFYDLAEKYLVKPC